ncbi:long-chain fatty acid--CoA ligase [Nevskia sp.]|uniref:acyl-CoA synthetase n=1 Tax=Nevskia sp. TaxID=1929292 RepID=UPI0025DA0FF0|nr:long-chain fatty acid--CoA ligase [Nevskia sp.]
MLTEMHNRSIDPQGLAEWFRRRALRAPERAALSFKDHTLSYGEMQKSIERMAAVFVSGGVRAGDRVAWLSLNHSLIMVALFACARIGAIFVPLNFRLSRPELADIINDAGAHTLVADTQHAAVIEPARAELPCRRYLLLDEAELGWGSLSAGMSDELPVPAAVNGLPDDVALLIYTSGTTGRPKGVMLSNGNLWTNNINWLLASDYTSQDVTLNCAPLFHVGGICVVLLPTLLVGGHVVLQQSFDPLQFLNDLERYKVTVTFAVPAMMLFASQHERYLSADLSAMRLIVAGGAPVPEPLLHTYNARGIPVSQCYGMTEATAGVTFLETERAITKLGSCGRPGLLTEVKLIDRDGNTITTPGERGEICMRGGNITQGYWNRPAETAAALDADGWMHSGDGAWVDADGFYTMCDRIKDMIISGGENIYPAEIESLLYEHPAIAEVAVIGAADARWGETVVVIAVLKAGQGLDLETLLAFVAPRLARYKLPKALHVIETMPRNPNGKIVKTELRKRFA